MNSPIADPSVARLFVGLWPDAEVRDAVLACAARWTWPSGARRVPWPKLHATLHFLGAVPRERVAGLVQGLAVPFEPFSLQLDQAEVWPNEVAVLRPVQVPHELKSLHLRLRIALMQLDQPTARDKLVPHVTLARRAGGARAPAEPPSIRWAVGGYALIESMPSSAYRVLQDYP
ncbi:MAG TPA: RNA 2',3'-cyclic phosphodiesterase [Albitalea sp.]|nr:RNA 2',3'-cyclic phosphodiesterase [Albitalea sp.]